tara:strand:- start:176 stop:439 length:264 start_codon:yes stop_codon:yes gene_type:complete
MKKIKPIWWIVIAIAVYFLFIRETTEVIIEPDPDADPNARQKCGGKKCTKVRRRGFLGIGRRVGKDWCSPTGRQDMPCSCLGESCGR